MKPCSESCVRNQSAILTVLEEILRDRTHVLEIASGTGQHAVHFGRALPHLTWHTSELAGHHAGIQAWLDDAQLANVLPPVVLDVNDTHWPIGPVDAIFNANTVHIVSWSSVERMFEGAGSVLRAGGVLCLYGPFNYGGTYTSDSNAGFDVWLKNRDTQSGIRDFEAINLLAERQGMVLVQDIAMPANNRMLVWHKPEN